MKRLSYIKNNVIILSEVQKNAESKNPEMTKTNKGKIILISRCTVCDNKKLRFIKNQEASRLLSSLELPLSKIPLFGDIFF